MTTVGVLVSSMEVHVSDDGGFGCLVARRRGMASDVECIVVGLGVGGGFSHDSICHRYLGR
jgi:hypothetical protein